MTPAEELAAAADKLDALLAETAPDWRLTDDNHLALAMIEMPHMIGSTQTSSKFTLSGPNDRTTQYIAAMNPLVGKALAANLRSYQVAVERHWRVFHEMWKTEQRIRMMDDQMPGLVQALDLARLINGGES